MIKLKRIYEVAQKEDGFRVLVDRLWPRGVSKEKAQLDLWLKDVAPTTELRKWFGHDPEKWVEFEKKYKIELKANTTALEQLKLVVNSHKQVTFLYGAKDTIHNEAVVLQRVLE